ncbi:thiamine pyrophosphate-dependent enzyme [Chloroflexota bacterium]
MSRDMEKYLRPGISSTPFCPGCGHGILMGLILRAIDELSLNFDDILFVSGIGCAAWIPSPNFNADTLHTLHGRAIAMATGAKMCNPKLNTIVVSGDGDLLDIGGNHLIHAARRNIDLTVICANNSIYGMTGGQAASTTTRGALTATTGEGSPYHPFDACRLVMAAGGTYAARYSVAHPLLLIKGIKKALQTKGFSFIEALSPCHAQFGRRNDFRSPADLLQYQLSNCISREEAGLLNSEDLKGKIITGEFHNGTN